MFAATDAIRCANLNKTEIKFAKVTLFVESKGYDRYKP